MCMAWRPIGPGESDVMLVASGDLQPRVCHGV
jgi:hypothetical protein